MKRIEDQRPKKKWIVIILGSTTIVLAVVGALASIGYIKYRQVQAAMAAPPPPEAPISVNLVTAESINFRRSSVVVGTVLAPQSIRLRTELTGVITEIPMTPGQIVRKGDLLVQFDIRTEEAELKSALASEGLSKTTYERAQRLAKANASSTSEIDIASAELVRSQAEVERIRVLIEKKTLRAPFDARVGLFNLHVGQYLDAGSEITNLEGISDHLLIDFAMPSHVADSIGVGDQVRVQPIENVPEVPAEIVAIDANADVISRSVTARARLNNPPANLQPNDSIRVVVEYGPEIPAIAVPATAVRRGPTGTLVFVATERDGALRAESRDVILAGGGNGRVAWIAKGLQAGERIAGDGSFKVFDGVLLAQVNQAASTADANPDAIVPSAAETTGSPGADNASPSTVPANVEEPQS